MTSPSSHAGGKRRPGPWPAPAACAPHGRGTPHRRLLRRERDSARAPARDSHADFLIRWRGAAARQRSDRAGLGEDTHFRLPRFAHTAPGMALRHSPGHRARPPLEQTAVSQNRDIQIAIARIREYRADVGVARAPTLPAVTANGAVKGTASSSDRFPPRRTTSSMPRQM